MFVGREEELNQLDALWNKVTKTSLVTVRGRRRIGKSTLIERFASKSGARFLKVEGLSPKTAKSNQDQLKAFYSQLQLQTGKVYEVKDWLKAFSDLDASIQDDRRMVVLLDEISWMGRYDKNFPGLLKVAWDNLFHRHESLILFLCGSVSSWIRENILDNTGFTGRFSRDYILPELSLAECAEFWREARDRVAPSEVFDVLSVTGGVPRYLEEMDPGLSAEENIRRMCFLPSGELFKDFDAIFSPIFGKEIELKRRILEALADGPFSGADLSAKFDLERGGRVSAVLRELKEGGFITDDPSVNPETGRPARVGRYRLKDNYTRFYLKFVAPRKSQIECGTFRFASLNMLPGWDAVMGLQFENLIVNNAMSLVPDLHLGGAIVESAAPYRNMRKGEDGKRGGCQVDLMIQTPMTAYVVEIKRKKRMIDGSIIDEVSEKLRKIPRRSGLSLRPVLVYEGELDPAVEGSGYFDSVIRAERLLRK